jgi:hypothetical protein
LNEVENEVISFLVLKKTFDFGFSIFKKIDRKMVEFLPIFKILMEHPK